MESITLKQARLLTDMTQRELAKKLGVSVPTYIRFEKNPELLTIKQAKIIAQTLKYPVDAFLFAQTINQ